MDRQIDPFLHQVEGALGHQQFDRDVGVVFQKGRQAGYDIKPSEHRRERDADQPRGRALPPPDEGFRCIKVVDQAQGGLVEALPGFGDRHAARCPPQQLRAQTRFKLRDLLADGGLPDPGFTRGHREAAALHHPDEQPHRIEPVHGGALIHSLLE